MLAFETKGDFLVVRKVVRGRDEDEGGIFDLLSEWASQEDEEAWLDL